MLDGGNISGATRLILRHTPQALITNETVPLIQELHPQKGVQGTSPTVTHPKQNDDPAFLDYDDKMLHRIFTGLKTGKGCGPYANNVDIIKSAALFKRSLIPGTPNKTLIWSYLIFFARNQIPHTVRTAYSAQWLTLLHKEWPVQPNTTPKLRPINPGISIRRVVMAAIAKAERHNLAKEAIHCNNFGVGAQSGSQFVALSTLVQCKKYLYRSIDDLHNGHLPTCVLVSIDMENMFNDMSRAQCRRIILRHFPALTSAFDSIYQTVNIIYYKTSDGAIQTIIQKEGVAQGCS
eukprot:15339431-Ditylum_brightwellii.AAC.1